MKRVKPFVLIILDGWGISPPWGGNAIAMGQTPNMDRYWAKYPHCELQASGTAVGLPGHEMGNSEVGHLNLGTGRVIRQDVSRISETITDKSFFENQTLNEAVKQVKNNSSSLHLAGLVSNGGVHSHIDHLMALLEFAKIQNLKSVFVHVFCDGRDTPPESALSFISKLEEKMTELKTGKIATISGRYFAMDRDKRWDRTEKAYRAIADGEGQTAANALSCISHSYAEGKNDEFIVPTVIASERQPMATVNDNDAIIFFNFRADRMRQLLYAFYDKNFNEFKINRRPKNLYITTMVPYDYEIKDSVKIIFPIPEKIENCLSEVLANNGLKQLHVAETEKYAHVTYFFNGGREEPFAGEDRILVPSAKVATYDLQPEMSANQIKDKIISNLKRYDFIVVNFANPDMVGHTGNMKAAIQAVETVDKCLGEIVEKIQQSRGLAIICADHGNAEQMLNPTTSEPDTEHTSNLVPFIIIDGGLKFKNLHQGKLANVAPTILDIMGIAKPSEMKESSLFDIKTSQEEQNEKKFSL